MKKLFTIPVAAALVVGLAFTASDAHAQGGLLNRMKKAAEDAAKQKIVDRTGEKAGEATDKSLDKAECAATGAKCDEAQAAAVKGGSASDTAPAAPAATAAPGVSAASATPGEGAWRNFDFDPGERTIFSDDFSGDKVGDFPKRFELDGGTFEIIEWEGRRFLSTNSRGEFSIALSEQLAERFTLEFDYSAYGSNFADIYFGGRNEGDHIAISEWESGVKGTIDAMGMPPGDETKYRNKVFPVRIMADGQHVKVYMGADRVANVPRANLGRSNTIRFHVFGYPDRPAMVGNVRIAAGGADLYDALSTAGRVTTQGILFDVGSDRIRPESTPTLTQIGRMLEQHAELKLAIEGHTDNAGDPKANLSLSEKRAAAVKEYLVSKHKIEAARLTTSGLGDTKPVTPNASPEGRQQNRRVELVKH